MKLEAAEDFMFGGRWNDVSRTFYGKVSGETFEVSSFDREKRLGLLGSPIFLCN